VSARLRVSIGQYSDKGRKPTNQDAYGARIPDEPLLSLKGIALALADGVSSSDVSQVASQAAVATFLEDYYCTADAWSVKTSGERVLGAVNSWLCSQTQSSPFRYERDRGYVCTFSALVLKSATAHVFHAGDARIYRYSEAGLEQLTEDHRIRLSEDKSYLSRALGVEQRVEVDYRAHPLHAGMAFLLVTDGVYEAVPEAELSALLANLSGLTEPLLNQAAERLAQTAHTNGSSDNLTVQIVRVDAVPAQSPQEVLHELSRLPYPPVLEPRMQLDGYSIVRELHASQRSRVYLARDTSADALVAIKTPAIDVRDNEALLESFLVEEWIARRIDNPHVLRAAPARPRSSLYLVSEYVEGQSLRQWMLDHPRPDLETVRAIVEQIARGLLAFHKLEMLHQDLRPDNILLDPSGTVKILDFGSVHVAGIAEMEIADAGGAEHRAAQVLGTEQYSAPEYFLGAGGSARSDLFSLAVITYQMLSGRLPYGTQVAQVRSQSALHRLHYISVLDENRELPAWLDDTLRRALHPDPDKRYETLSEFVYDLRHPSPSFLSRERPPLLQRNPVAFWRGLCGILVLIIVWLVMLLRQHGQ
jgi:serine/threonine protein phosphatase PrpC